ncbi:34357_t:CDS:2 [Gigaspora margarita]|uniref:34357_t:CDS:1 n=1 Tax=Gigaspora margarita TaxID=4874 RepID=A0ABM8W4R9_GIGMA|nr:34357_t:CDS:2 [Gigaspora margarita]
MLLEANILLLLYKLKQTAFTMTTLWGEVSNWKVSGVFNLQIAESIKTGTDIFDMLKKYRDLWWCQGNLHPKAEWEKAKLPYVLAENVTIDKYEERTDRFNVHGLWEWNAKLEKNDIILGDVTVHELPTPAHEVCIGKISYLIMKQCDPVMDTDARICNFQAAQPDSSFRPKKSAVDLPNGSDGLTTAWPNIVIEVALSESVSHAKDKARNYWLHCNRVHDVIIVKLYCDDSKTPVPRRMKAWHYRVSGTSVQQKLKPKNKFEFGTHDANEGLLNYEKGTRVIKIPLDCLYHDVKPPIQVPRSILPDPIILDFFYVREEILFSFT